MAKSRRYTPAIVLLLAGTIPAWAEEKIILTSDRLAPGSRVVHLWKMNPDGTDFQQITFGNVNDQNPKLSSDGRRVVFARAIPPLHDCTEIWVKDLHDGTETQLTSSTALNSNAPAWSRDGSQIAFNRSVVRPGCNSGAEPGSARIWALGYTPPALPSPVQVTSSNSFGPDWSPDGTFLLYSREIGGSRWQLFKVTLASGLEEPFLPPGGIDAYAHYSPDGHWITFCTDRHGDYQDVYLASAADPAGTQFRVSPYTGFNQSCWSPDGTRLAMLSTAWPHQIHTVNVDGTGLQALTSPPAAYVPGSWGILSAPDSIAPATTPSPVPPPGAWFNHDVTITLSAVDNPGGSGVRDLTWSLAGAQNSPPQTVPGDAATTVISSEGETALTFHATDNAGNAAEPQSLVIRIDKSQPVLDCQASPNILWPPNKKMHSVSVTVTPFDALSGAGSFLLLSTASNEPTPGSIQNFAIGTADTLGLLQADRLGTGTGRIYSLTYQASDLAGNTARCTAKVTVPHDQGN